MSTDSYRWHYDYARIIWDAGFCFNSNNSVKAFDRNGIALLDIEKIIRDRDIRIVDHHIENILEYTLDSEEARILDPTFVKLFRLSQLAVDYLNYCRKYLDTTTDTLKQELSKAYEENEELKNVLMNYKHEICKLKKKIKELKSALHIHQKYQPSGTLQVPVGTFRCNECRKGFLNAEYLKKHFLKRHPESNEFQNFETKLVNQDLYHDSTTHPQYKAETDKLQMEIKELKEKLNNTERLFQTKTETPTPAEEIRDENESKTKSEEYYRHVEELHHQFELLKTQIESEMQLLKTQKSEEFKYEELMAKFLHKLDEKNEKEVVTAEIHVDQINESITSKDTDIIIEKNIETVEEAIQVEINIEESSVNQPSEEIETVKEEKTPLKNLVIHKIQEISIPPVEQKPVDVEKLKKDVERDLERKAQQNIERLGKQISANISNTFDVLQDRLESFWTKLQEIEIDRDREKQDLINKLSVKTEVKTPEIIKIEENQSKNIPEIIKIHENIKIDQSSIDDDSETESSKNENVKPESVLKSIQKNDQKARNLIAELKTKVQERNSTNVEQKKPVVIPRKTIVEKPVPQQIYAKTIKTKSTTEESESESEYETETESDTETPVVKPSKTTTSSKSPKAITITADAVKSSHTGITSLQNRSISSLENALISNPDILTQLRKDMKDIIDDRLKDLGVDPEWTRIPEKTYKQNCEIVTHHRTMAAKNMKHFMDIRNDIIENLEDHIKGVKRKESRELTTPEPDIEPKSSRFKSLFQNMRNKAKSIMKHEKTATPSPPIYKLTVHQHSTPNITQSLKKNKEISKSKATEIKDSKEKRTMKKTAMYDTDSEDESETDISKNVRRRHIQPKSVSTKKDLHKTKSETNMEVTELSDHGMETNTKDATIHNLARSLDSILEMKKELAGQQTEEKVASFSSLDTIDNAKDEVVAFSSKQVLPNELRNKNLIQKTIEAEKNKLEIASLDLSRIVDTSDSDTYKDDDKIQKGVLKNVTSSAVVKKKVLFDLNSENTKTSETNDEKPVELLKAEDSTPLKKTIVKSNVLFKANKWDVSSSSIDSSILELKKGTVQQVRGQGDTISTKALINVSTKQYKTLDDASDWDISDIN